MKLLIRPRWKDGESWCGYLMRIADANSLPGVLTIAKLNRIPYAQLILGNPVAALKELKFSHKEVPFISLQTKVGTKKKILPKWCRPKNTQICPECLRTDSVPYFRAIWERQLEVVCRIHKLRLVDHCPNCELPIQTRSGIYLHCHCGLDFKELTSTQSATNSDQIRKVMGLESPSDCEMTFRPLCGRENLAFTVLESLARESGHAPSPGDVAKKRKKIHSRYDIVRLSAAWFEDWPRCFMEKLREASLQSDTKGVFHRRQHQLHLNEFAELRTPIEALIRSRAIQRKQSTRADIARIDPMRMTLTQAQAYLGITRDKCIAWVEAGSLGPVDFSHKQGFSLRYVAATHVQKVGALLKTTISVQEASEICGLNPRSIYALIKSDILTGPRLLKHEMTTRLNEEDVRTFADSIVEVSVKRRRDPTARSLSEVIYEVYDYVGKEHILALVLFLKEKYLPIYRDRNGEVSLDSLFIPRSAVARLYRLVRNGHPIST